MLNTKYILGIELTIMPSILEVHHQQENMMVSNVACVITSYLLMVFDQILNCLPACNGLG